MNVTIVEVPSNEIDKDDVISYEGSFYQVVSEPVWGATLIDPLILAVEEVALSADGEIRTMSSLKILKLDKRRRREDNTSYFRNYIKVEFTE